MTLHTPMKSTLNLKVGGHSTWQEALKIAEKANVKNTFFFIMTLHTMMTEWIKLQLRKLRLIQLHDQQWKAKRLICDFF